MDDDDTGMPRWVKITIGAMVAVALLALVLLLLGQGHGPGRHFSERADSGIAIVAMR